MNIGQYIKKLRTEKGLTQEEVGAFVGVQRAAVQKWESGMTQNIKRTALQRLAELFNVPATSFIAEIVIDKEQEEVRVIEKIEEQYGKKSIQLLRDFTKLNEMGQDKALENLSDLIEIPKYVKKIRPLKEQTDDDDEIILPVVARSGERPLIKTTKGIAREAEALLVESDDDF